MRDLLDVETLLALPDLDLSKPLPLGETITPAMESMFAEQSALFREIWQPVTKLKTWIEDVREQFGLQDELRPRGHVIGFILPCFCCRLC